MADRNVYSLTMSTDVVSDTKRKEIKEERKRERKNGDKAGNVRLRGFPHVCLLKTVIQRFL